MGLTMSERKAVTREKAKKYRRASKKAKGRILDEFVELTGLNRVYAAWLLRSWGRVVWFKRDGQPVRVEVGTRRARRRMPKRYDEPTRRALIKIWYLFGCMCGKRLVVVLRSTLGILERWGEITLSAQVRGNLQSISAATIDRLLRAEKRKLRLKGRSHTKPTTRLMSQIPIRTFSEWADVPTGTVGVDLVGHDGGNPSGEFCFTLLLSDRQTCWTEPRAVLNKARRWVFLALLLVRSQLPFPLRSLHSDNGSEFINNHLFNYCREQDIDFTRCRPYRRNDNNFVEQKNYDVVRKHVGYARYCGHQHLELLNQLYDQLRLLINFFYPCSKLIQKTRQGARVTRRYDSPRTPCQRVLERDDVDEQFKERLRRQFQTLNPAALQRETVRLYRRLIRLAIDQPVELKRVG